ncbi:MAG: class I SAM-dependent methyltransferase [Oscillospiraceae bacterium]|jgi:23S rRNA (cytosine1962-C5)-methyltransferase|nr:class I SAM-dependent methyltransferase [Oscillospiraceae bacterium]
MRTAKNWKDFELLDASSGERLERWGDIILIRPDPQVIWKTNKTPGAGWGEAHAVYTRSGSGGGSWDKKRPVPEEWIIKRGDLRFIIRPTGFKHTGLFPEQAANWDLFKELLEGTDNPSVLNLFAYTGGATLACAAAGATVCHVDAARGMVSWAKRNAEESGLGDRPIRWITDDCFKFAQRELRRENRYHGLIMDPPSYGRGPGGEVWKLEECVYDLVELCAGLLDASSRFLLLNSYSTGLGPSVMGYLLERAVCPRLGGRVESYELGLEVAASGGILPCGSSALWRR